MYFVFLNLILSILLSLAHASVLPPAISSTADWGERSQVAEFSEKPIPKLGNDPRDLSGSSTKRSSAACTLFVATSGNDSNSGRSLSDAIRSTGRAVEIAGAGETVCFDEGEYSPLIVSEKVGTAKSPIVFRTLPGKEHLVTFTTYPAISNLGIDVSLSEHIHVYDFRVANVQKGIEFASSSYCRAEGNLVENLQTEGILVTRLRTWDGSNQFLGGDSHHADVIGNTIRNTGLGTAIYGEGIYIGSGSMAGDQAHDIFIAYNYIEETRAELIELKPYAYNIVVRGNTLINSSHDYNGAITVSIEDVAGKNGNYLIEDNRIYNFKQGEWTVSGIAIGHGNAIVRNNLIWQIEGGRGIRIYRTFANEDAKDLIIANNIVWTPGGGDSISLYVQGGDGRSKPPLLRVFENLTDDGSLDSQVGRESSFLGPITGTADSGDGLGSGFRPKISTKGGVDFSRIIFPAITVQEFP